jgi:cytochrome P450
MPPRPAAPIPPTKPAGALTTYRRLHDNLITGFSIQCYEAPVTVIKNLFRTTYLVNDPAALEQILVTKATQYRKSALQQRRLKPALGEGLLTAEDEAWRAARRLAAPSFNPRAISLIYDDMQDVANAMAARWHARPDPAAAIDLLAELQHLTFDIVSKTIFSGALDEHRVSVHASMALYFETLGRFDLGAMLNLPGWVPSLAQRRARPALKIFRTLVERAVQARADTPPPRPQDLLNRLMAAEAAALGTQQDVARVADNVLTFMSAGHETTANALAWIFYLLALFPETEARVLAELTDGGAEQKFTRAVVNEALRLYPPAPFMAREALAADEIAGHKIKAGAQIVISPWILHRHRLLWPQPDDFVPERFLNQTEESLGRGRFIPFGLGPRVCIGQGFSIQEILIVLNTILPAFQMRLVDPDAVVPQARITLYPRGGLPMVITPRA